MLLGMDFGECDWGGQRRNFVIGRGIFVVYVGEEYGGGVFGGVGGSFGESCIGENLGANGDGLCVE